MFRSPVVVEQDSTHGNSTTWEVWVVVGTWRKLDTGWWLIWVTSQQRENVVTTTVSGLDNQREIRRQSTLIGSSGSLFVGIRTWDVVGKLTWSLSWVTLVIWFIVVFELFSHGSGFALSVRNTNKRSPSNSVQGMACCANLSVDLETSSNGGMVKCIKHTTVGPSVFWSVQTVLGSSHGLSSLGILVKNISRSETDRSNDTLHYSLGVGRHLSLCGRKGSESQWSPQRRSKLGIHLKALSSV
ncbi:hypothetical protein OGATHE_006491 [Ogataea polymorpha]|uniref:Uncharacterized protein n=1 Tax=Ogataea polymorpha TaxID=460523 RepID=A0A9P8NSB5_9ASCO|nr:hypothetical protein OGATHE_006491 [Ogataea polymorpha]